MCVMSNSENLNYQRFIMIRDREADICGAHDNHIESITVLWGYEIQDELLVARPNYLAKTPNEVFQILIAE